MKIGQDLSRLLCHGIWLPFGVFSSLINRKQAELKKQRELRKRRARARARKKEKMEAAGITEDETPRKLSWESCIIE